MFQRGLLTLNRAAHRAAHRAATKNTLPLAIVCDTHYRVMHERG